MESSSKNQIPHLELREEGIGYRLNGIRAVIGNGFEVIDIMTPDLIADVEIKEHPRKRFTEQDVLEVLTNNGIRQKYYFHYDGNKGSSYGKALFSERQDLERAVEIVDMCEDINFRLVPRNYNKSQMLQEFTIRLKWYRRPSLCFCYIKLHNPELTEVLVGSEIKIQSFGPLKVKRRSQEENTLVIHNLDPDIKDQHIKDALAGHLGMTRSDLEDEVVVVVPREHVKYHPNESERVHKIITTQVSNFVELETFTVKVEEFMETQVSSRAFLKFTDSKNCETAYKGLTKSGIRVGNKISTAYLEFKASVFIPKDIFDTLKPDIHDCMTKFNSRFTPRTLLLSEQESGGFFVNISTTSQYKLAKMRMDLDHMIEGEIVKFEPNEHSSIFFTSHGKEKLEEIMLSTEADIILNEFARSVTLRGLKVNKLKALKLICDYVTKIVRSTKLTLSLGNKISPNILRGMLCEYGSDLSGFVSITGVYSIDVNLQDCVIEISGEDETLTKAEKLIDDLKESNISIEDDKQVEANSKQVCVVCLCPVGEFASYEIPSCHHVYCNVCLLGVIHNFGKHHKFPIQCISKDCGKTLSVSDIYAIYDVSEVNKAHLVQSAVRKFVWDNETMYRFCISPKCDAVYRVGSIYKCPQCHREICTLCKAPFHQGVSCRMYAKAQSKQT